MLSASFTTWVYSLDARERVLTPAKRNESLKEFFANRSSK
jgi:hypothetical protein